MSNYYFSYPNTRKVPKNRREISAFVQMQNKRSWQAFKLTRNTLLDFFGTLGSARQVLSGPKRALSKSKIKNSKVSSGETIFAKFSTNRLLEKKSPRNAKMTPSAHFWSHYTVIGVRESLLFL